MPQRNSELLKALIAEEVVFVVVGGVAANIHGSSVGTYDFDVVAPLTLDNCERILKALGPHSPRFYQSFGKPRVERTAEQLSAFRNLYFSTDLGVIDLLGSLPPVGDYERVAAKAETVMLFGLACKVVSLEDLIAVKQHVGRPKDKLVEVELRAIQARLKGPPPQP